MDVLVWENKENPKRQHPYLQMPLVFELTSFHFSICPWFPYIAKTMWVYRNISVYNITTFDNFSICIVCIQSETFSMESSVIFIKKITIHVKHEGKKKPQQPLFYLVTNWPVWGRGGGQGKLIIVIQWRRPYGKTPILFRP